jgi:hypothetical protein
MARILITRSSHEGRLPLSLNGRQHILMVPRDGKGEVDVPDEFLPLLTDSNIDFEIVATGNGDGEAEAGAGGNTGAVSATDPEAGPGSLGTIDESSNTAMPATPPVAAPTSGGAPGAGAANERDAADNEKAEAEREHEAEDRADAKKDDANAKKARKAPAKRKPAAK